MEYLVTMTTQVPAGTSPEAGTPASAVDETLALEAQRAKELATQGHLLRLWSLPALTGRSRALGLWQARGPSVMEEILRSLPVAPWATMDTTPLSRDPSDPGRVVG